MSRKTTSCIVKLVLAKNATLYLRQILMHVLDRHGPLSYCRGHPVHRACPHIAGGEDAGAAALQQEGIAVELPDLIEIGVQG